MPRLRISPDLEMQYLVDDYTDPWRKPEAVLLLHGNSESGAAWYGWVPHLARHYVVVRPDMRGFGDSTPMPREFPWTLDIVIDDYVRLMDMLKIERFHLVGAKIGGVIARAFAARRPNRVRTLTVVGSPPPLRTDRERQRPMLKELEQDGIESWSRRTTASRLGKAFPGAGYEWWIKFMGRTPLSSELGFIGSINYSDIRSDMPKIKSVDAGFYRIPLEVALSDSTHGVMEAFELITVRVRDADDQEGVGYTYTTGRNAARSTTSWRAKSPRSSQAKTPT